MDNLQKTVFSSFLSNLNDAGILVYELRGQCDTISLVDLNTDDTVALKIRDVDKLITDNGSIRLFEQVKNEAEFAKLIRLRNKGNPSINYLVFLHQFEPICIVSLKPRDNLSNLALKLKNCTPGIHEEVYEAGVYTLISSMYTNDKFQHLKKIFIHFSFVFASRKSSDIPQVFVGVSNPCNSLEFSDCELIGCGLTKFNVQYNDTELNNQNAMFADKFFINDKQSSYTWGSNFWGKLTNFEEIDRKYFTINSYTLEALFRRGIYSCTNPITEILDVQFMVPSLIQQEDYEFPAGYNDTGDVFQEDSISKIYQASIRATETPCLNPSVPLMGVCQSSGVCSGVNLCQSASVFQATSTCQSLGDGSGLSVNEPKKSNLRVHHVTVPDTDINCDFIEYIMREQIFFMHKIPLELRVNGYLK